VSRKATKNKLRPSIVAIALGLIGLAGQVIVLLGSASNERNYGWHVFLAASFVCCTLIGVVAYVRERKAP
jgi:hypothetical protein